MSPEHSIVRRFPPDLQLGMLVATLCKTEAGVVLAPEHCFTPGQAFHMFTQEAAYSLFCDDNRGSMEAGKLPDLTVLSENPLTVSIENFKSKVCVEMTLVDDEVVYQKNQNSKKIN